MHRSYRKRSDTSRHALARNGGGKNFGFIAVGNGSSLSRCEKVSDMAPPLVLVLMEVHYSRKRCRCQVMVTPSGRRRHPRRSRPRPWRASRDRPRPWQVVPARGSPGDPQLVLGIVLPACSEGRHVIRFTAFRRETDEDDPTNPQGTHWRTGVSARPRLLAGLAMLVSSSPDPGNRPPGAVGR